MSDLGLYIGASGLNAAQQSMNTVAENLANADTPGYVQETTNVSASTVSGTLGVGTGVTVTGVAQTSDAVMDANTNAAQSMQANLSTVQQSLSSLQAIFPEPSGNGISSQLSSFWQAWDTVSQNPTQSANLATVIGQAQGLATSLNQASNQMQEAAGIQSQQLSSSTSTVNSLLSEVAQLNQSIVASSAAAATPNSLVDQRNALVSQLATQIGATTQPQMNGAVNVYVGGITAVQGDVNDSFSIVNSGSGYSLVSNATGTTVPVSGGTIAGLLTELNTDIPNYQDMLNGVATDLADTVNNQLALGYTASGTSASASATAGGTTPIAASTTITTGVNDTVDLTEDGTPYTLTVAPGTYTPSELVSAINAAATTAGAPVSAALTATGNLILSTTDQGATASLQVTGGDALATLGMSAMASAAVGGNGLPLFTTDGGLSTPTAGSITAGNLTVNSSLVANPMDLAVAGSQPTPPNTLTSDGSNAQAMAELYDSTTGPDQAYQEMITTLGGQLQSVNNQTETQASLVTGLTTVQQSVEGVNTDQQTVNMLSYQQAYQASAKVIQTIASMMQSLIEAT